MFASTAEIRAVANAYGAAREQRPKAKRDLASNDRSFGLTRAIWLHLLREGGRWSAAEIAAALKVNPKHTRTMLVNMVRTNAVQRWDKTESPKSRLRYGVTPTCVVPQGITLSEIVALARAE